MTYPRVTCPDCLQKKPIKPDGEFWGKTHYCPHHRICGRCDECEIEVSKIRNKTSNNSCEAEKKEQDANQ